MENRKKSLMGFLSVLATVAAPSLAAAHVGAIAMDAFQHSQLHLFEGFAGLFVINTGIHLLRRLKNDRHKQSLAMILSTIRA
jgi:hypothetical protein